MDQCAQVLCGSGHGRMVALIQTSLRKQPERLAAGRQCVARVRVIFFLPPVGENVSKLREEMV